MKESPIKEINFLEMPSIELLEYISFREEFASEAEMAFEVFCKRFEKDIIEKSEIYCNRFSYSEVVALEIAHCTFARVWKYPTFKKEKRKTEDIDKAILLWMYPIIYTQIIKYGQVNTCAEPTIEEDLCIVENADELIDVYSIDSIEKKRELKAKFQTIEKVLSSLSDKHKIIYYN